VRVHLIDPSAYTPPYDHALAAALARAGAQVTLHTGPFAYAEAPVPEGYEVRERFYRRTSGAPASRRSRTMSGRWETSLPRKRRREAGAPEVRR
jgi:hypothetical protein